MFSFPSHIKKCFKVNGGKMLENRPSDSGSNANKALKWDKRLNLMRPLVSYLIVLPVRH